MNIKLRSIPILLLCSILNSSVFSQSLSSQGLLAGWLTGNTKKTIKPQIGLRYIPTFSLTKPLKREHSLDLEFSLNSYGTGRFDAIDDLHTDGDVNLYRLWLRFSSSQFEARIGLQKINFGSAALLRPLMWFDSIDPRDPLQLTDGVYGILVRYFFLNNANIWVWGLYGNDRLKGWESFASDGNIPEFGGRVQIPLGNGEAAFTYHHREIEVKGLLKEFDIGASRIPENRFALDGKWDIGVGIWFEGVLLHQNSEALPYPWQRALNLGLDYTFGLENGLNITAEHFVLTSSRKAFGSGDSFKFSALALNYPLSLLDTLSSIFYFDWKNDKLYSFLRWQRTYDNWRINFMAFWNPESFEIYQISQDSSLFSGKGFQIMIVYNY